MTPGLFVFKSLFDSLLLSFIVWNSLIAVGLLSLLSLFCEFLLTPLRGINIAVEQLEGTFVVLFFLSIFALTSYSSMTPFENDLVSNSVTSPFSDIGFSTSVWRYTSTCLELSSWLMHFSCAPGK